MIDLCIANSPQKIDNSAVVHLSINDHPLIFMTIKISYEGVGTQRTIETRVSKYNARTIQKSVITTSS